MKFGFTARLAFLIVTCLTCLAIAVAAVNYVQRGRATNELPRVPMPDQVAAMVQLLESQPLEDRALLLRAFNTPRSQTYIAPKGLTASGRIRFYRTESVFQKFFKNEDWREIRVYVSGDANSFLGQANRYLVSDFSVSLKLKSGEYLIINKRDSVNASVFGLPAGFWAGLIGLFVSSFVMIGVLREIGPLKRLAEHVQSFSHRATPVEVKEKGAWEVRLVIRAFNDMQERINGLLKERSFMLYAISHDLRTYLTRLRLRMEKVEGAARGPLVADVEDMSGLIGKALELAKIETGEVEKRDIDLVALVREECAKAGGDQGVVAFHGGMKARVAVHVDELSVRRILANILDNAVKYGGRADVGLRERTGGVEVLIDDRGPGIPVEARALVLEPFRRLETSRNLSTGGVGLGLAIAKELAVQNDGRVVIEENPGGGARVIVGFRVV